MLNLNLKVLLQILEKGKFINTITYDTGELHPWTTWPTLHRGVNNNKHNIQFINQPLRKSRKYPPLWDILQDNGYKIGVFGSLQSYPPKIKKMFYFIFLILFLQNLKHIQINLKIYQEFNLKVCSENKAISLDISKDIF